MTKPGLPVVNADGTPKWRMAPSPHGPYWEEGMKLGYQDAGSWTMLKSTPLERRKAAWLYAQFTVAKTTSLKKSHLGPDADPRLRHQTRGTDRAWRRSSAGWSSSTAARRACRGRRPAPTCPTIPKLAQLWWQNIARR